MADYPISNVPRRVQYVNSGVGPYAFTFAVLVQTDIAVYRGNTLLTLTTDYSVVINANGTGSITLVTAGTGNITIVGARAIQRTSDYTTGGDLFASTLNTDLDSQTIFSQQLAENINRTVTVPITDASTLDMQLPVSSVRSSKLLGFSSTGSPTVSTNTIAAVDAAVNTITSIAGAPSGSSAGISHISAGAGAVTTTVQAKLRQTVSVKDFGAAGDGVTDDTSAIQNALNSGLGIVYFPAGIYIVTSEIVVPDTSGIIGAGAHWKRRTAYSYTSGQTVFKYTGAGGSNSCVIRLSNMPVGVEGDDFTAPGTSDLVDIVVRDFHIDANNLAEIGCYVYRAGNQSTLTNITAEKAKKYCHVHLGCYAAVFGTFGAFLSEDQGVSVGWDLFNWGTVEATCFDYSATFLTSNNGTGGTYPADDLACSGGLFSVGRGSRVFITSERNEGRACIISSMNAVDYTIGPTDYYLEYIEGNADGPYIKYWNGSDAIRLLNGFIHPGNPAGTLDPQNITIRSVDDSGVITANQGPSDSNEWLILERLFGYAISGGVTYNFEIDSNTTRYKVIDCDSNITYADELPGANAISFNFAIEGSTVAGTQTYTVRNGYAVKNGSVVTVTGRVTLSALDVATSGDIRITGLPYPVAPLTNNFSVCSPIMYQNLDTSLVLLTGVLNGNTSYIDLRKLTAAGTSNISPLVAADLTNTTLLQFTATYITG